MTTTDIQPKLVTLSGLLSERLFRIPEYQRNYSWQRKQREDMFHDILRTWEAGDDRTHFMATLVGLRRDKRNIMAKEYQVVEVVDGQQRLTTLILLLKAIAKALDRQDSIEARIGRDLDEILVKPDETSMLLLQTNHDSSHYFADYLRKGDHLRPTSAKTIADGQLLSAMEECERFVRDWQSRGNPLEKLVSLLNNRLTFIFHEIGSEALVYTVFEVLNSRGLAVSWFDRLKSMLMAIVFENDTGNRDEIISEVHQIWTDIYRCLGLRLQLSTESLRFSATLRQSHISSRPLGEEESAYLLRDQSENGPPKVIETVKWLKDVTEALDSLRADHRRNAVTEIVQARLVATALKLRVDLNEGDKEKVLRRWENVTFRIYGIGRKDSRTAVGDYTRLAWRIVKEKPSANMILGELSKIGAKFPIAEAIKELQNPDRYDNWYEGWEEELRYFFHRYEEHLAREKGQTFDNEQWNRIWEASTASSIEHILPQSSGNGDVVHRLGNLMLLPPGLNSKLGSIPPSGKASDYNKTGLLLAHEVAEDLSNSSGRWRGPEIRKREAALLEWAQKEWAD